MNPYKFGRVKRYEFVAQKYDYYVGHFNTLGQLALVRKAILSFYVAATQHHLEVRNLN